MTTLKKVIIAIAILSLPDTSFSQYNQAQIASMATADSARLVNIFKDLHQHPELGFMEVRTASILARELKSLGYELVTGIGKTGLAGILRNGTGPVVMYRTDMDCNPVKETTGLPYASTATMKREDSTEVPVMHACGHDAHMTWMLGIARIMMQSKNEWKGTLVFVAQPAEELVKGARAMVDDGMYERGVPVPDYLFGMHAWPIPVGVIQNPAGERMAGTDQLDVTFRGIGGHGARPENTRDPIVMASTAVMQYQTIISRNISPQHAAVLTVGAFQAGSVNNVIPPYAVLKLNLRWFNDNDRKILLDGIRRINEGIAVANGLPEELYPEITMKGNVTPLINNDQLVSRVNKALSSVISPDNIVTGIAAEMGSEDFPLLVKKNSKTVYDFVMVGVANAASAKNAAASGEKYPFYNHNGNFQVDLSAIPLGTRIGAVALSELLRK